MLVQIKANPALIQEYAPITEHEDEEARKFNFQIKESIVV